jgi:hypothetical protein
VKLAEYESLGIPEHWIADYAGLGERQSVVWWMGNMKCSSLLAIDRSFPRYFLA